MAKIFSIGSGNEDLMSFINRLKKWSINCLVDLRSQPYSKYVPFFNQKVLSNALRRAKISYLYFGDKLGGRPTEGFDEFQKSPRFSENIDRLLIQIEGKNAVLMCSEFDISKCHRFFIVEEIVKKGIDVTVIDKEGNAEDFSSRQSKSHRILKDSKNQSKLTGYLQGDEPNE
jgi:uncharacterized protein (DUF488 family)